MVALVCNDAALHCQIFKSVDSSELLRSGHFVITSRHVTNL